MKSITKNYWGLAITLCLVVAAGGNVRPAAAQDSQPAAAESSAAPTVSWSVFSGWKRYGGNCATCHGPDGLGGTFAPSLVNSLKSIDQAKFLETVTNGKSDGNLTMPTFGANPNVMCYINDIYAYLKARSEGTLPRGRPNGPSVKPKEFADAENACMGG